MSKVQQAAGGGKVSTTNLAAGNVKSGVTVTVKQGSKTVQQVKGTYAPALRKVYIGAYGAVAEQSITSTFNVSGYPGYKNFTVDNFSLAATVSAKDGATGAIVTTSGMPAMSYNNSTGVLTISDTYRVLSATDLNSKTTWYKIFLTGYCYLTYIAY